jgi:EAL domain-containing protein (putative c-di-GMP-specific phosphodiesterase class I)
MSAAAQVLGALADGSFALARQPIVSVADPQRPVLYHEALLRLDCGGRWTAPHRHVRALERLGLIRLLDRDVVARAVMELEADPSITLGANISAQSARLDGWWLPLCDILRRRRDLAARLILEITDSSPFRSVAEAATFATRMRELGCRIAIKNFGANRASFRQLRALRPDLVKLDPFFLAQAETGPRDEAALCHVVGLAHAIAPIVVASGVETPGLARQAHASGATWLQGCLFGAPAVAPFSVAACGRAATHRTRRPSGAAGA